VRSPRVRRLAPPFFLTTLFCPEEDVAANSPLKVFAARPPAGLLARLLLVGFSLTCSRRPFPALFWTQAQSWYPSLPSLFSCVVTPPRTKIFFFFLLPVYVSLFGDVGPPPCDCFLGITSPLAHLKTRPRRSPVSSLFPTGSSLSRDLSPFSPVYLLFFSSLFFCVGSETFPFLPWLLSNALFFFFSLVRFLPFLTGSLS